MVEDSQDDALLIIRNISQDSFDIEYKRVETPETMETALSSKKWDIVLSDYNMPNFSGLDALKIFKKTGVKKNIIEGIHSAAKRSQKLSSA